MIGSRIYGDYTPLPEKYQEAINSGIRFVELHYPVPLEFPKSILGFFNVEVTTILVPGTLKTEYNEKWLTGKNAYIQFEKAKKNGLAVAFMPDDRYYHNRQTLVDNPQLIIHQMHTRTDGIIPGAFVKNEIQCLREVIHEKVPIFKIMDTVFNREITYFYTEEEAEAHRQKLAIKNNCKVVPGEKMKKKPYVLELIRRYGNQHTGWTDCDEFRGKILPQVNALIAQRKKSVLLDGDAKAPDLRSQLVALLSSLSPEEKTQLFSNINTEKATTEQVEDVAKFTKYSLGKKKVDELTKIAAAFGVSTERKNKDTLIEEILAAQTSQMMQEQPPVTETEQTSESEEEELIVT